MKPSMILLGLLLLCGQATAQALPPLVGGEPETVYSDAQRARDEDLSRRFIQSLLRSPPSLDGQFAKWERAICPHVFGLSPAAAYVLERRVREVAQQIGAPQDRADPCITNISIIVTETPQEKLDSLIKLEPLMFAAGAKTNLKISQPVQVFYTTFMRDFNGIEHLDVPWEDLGLPEAPRMAANVTRLHTGIKPVMGGAIVIVDAKAIMGQPLGTIGDYVAMLSLSQAPTTGRCQPAPSISNLLVAGCAADLRTTALSEVDLAMLTGLYQTPLEPERIQQARIIGNMRKALEAEFAGGQR